MKLHQPAAAVIYENIDTVVAATAYFARLLAPARRLDAMHPCDRPVNVDRGHLHRHVEFVKRWEVALPVPSDRGPTDVRMWINWRRDQDVFSGAGPHRIQRA